MTVGDSDLRIWPGRIHSTHAQIKSLHQPGDTRREESRIHLGSGSAWQALLGLWASAFGRAGSALVAAVSARRAACGEGTCRSSQRSFVPLGATRCSSLICKRDGVTRSGEQAAMFDAESDRADGAAFAECCMDDRHHFLCIVLPEDAGDMTDLKAFTRDLAKQMESDLGTRFDLVAVDHWNTDNPQVHLLVLGADEESDLMISRDYISRGLRSHAEELVELPSSWGQSRSMKSATPWRGRSQQSEGRGFTSRSGLPPTGCIDFRPENPGSSAP
jgi:hypothetical protein